MSLTGSGPDDPQRVGVPIGDLLAGMYGAYGVLAALHERDRTGRGQHVRTSLLAAVVGVHAFQGTRWTVAGEVGTAVGNHHPVDLPVRVVPLPRRRGADLGGQRRAVAAVLRRLRDRSRHRRAVVQPQAGGRPGAGDRDRRGRVRRLGRRAPAGSARRARGAGRQGAQHPRGVRVGADRQPGSADRRRPLPPWVRSRCPGRRCGSSTPTAPSTPTATMAPRPFSIRTGTTSALGCERRHEQEAGVGRPASCWSSSSTRARTSPGTTPSATTTGLSRTAASCRRRRSRPGPTRRCSPAADAYAAGRSRSSSASSPSSLGPSAAPRPIGSPPQYAARPPSGCRSWLRRPRAAPGCRKARPPSCGWSTSAGRWRSTRRHGCPIWFISGTPPPAVSMPRGDPSGTSRSPSPVRSSPSSDPRCTRRSITSRSPRVCRPRRTSPPRV